MSKALQAAIDLIADPARWTAHATARGADGEPVNIRSRFAVCWSAWGAMEKKNVSGLKQGRVDAYCRIVFMDGLSDTNDGDDGHGRAIEAMKEVQDGWWEGEE